MSIYKPPPIAPPDPRLPLYQPLDVIHDETFTEYARDDSRRRAIRSPAFRLDASRDAMCAATLPVIHVEIRECDDVVIASVDGLRVGLAFTRRLWAEAEARTREAIAHHLRRVASLRGEPALADALVYALNETPGRYRTISVPRYMDFEMHPFSDDELRAP